MEFEYARSFIKDARKLPEPAARQLAALISQIKAAGSPETIFHIKKMKGHPDAYRIRIGDYRVGVFLENNVLVLTRVLHRREIYRYFP